MFRRWLLVSLIGMALLVLVAACAQTAEAPETAPAEVQALIEDRCSGWPYHRPGLQRRLFPRRLGGRV
jgi:hypothetical protein